MNISGYCLLTSSFNKDNTMKNTNRMMQSSHFSNTNRKSQYPLSFSHYLAMTTMALLAVSTAVSASAATGGGGGSGGGGTDGRSGGGGTNLSKASSCSASGGPLEPDFVPEAELPPSEKGTAGTLPTMPGHI